MSIPLFKRRQLRSNSTDSEAALWQHLRNRRLGGLKFRRQHPFGPYILDFFCPERGLAIELDGGQHFDPVAVVYDARRTRYLTASGITLLRFTSDKVFVEREAVLLAIAAALGIDRSSAIDDPRQPLCAR